MLQALAVLLPATEPVGSSHLRAFVEDDASRNTATVAGPCAIVPFPTEDGEQADPVDDGVVADLDRDHGCLLSIEESAWTQRPYELTGWIRPFVVRWDRHGRYWPKSQRHKHASKNYTAKAKLRLKTLNWHFRGGTDGDVVGILLIKRDRFGRCWSRCCVVDIDRHDESVDPGVTLAYALVLYERAKGLGLNPLLLDSNGDGGYHLWLLFDRDVPTQHVYSLGRWLVRDHVEHGLAKIEAFPKKPTIKDDPTACGNWIRLPGRHHTHDHWSKVWDGESWLAGNAAIDVMLATTGADPDVIPAVVRDYAPAAPERPRRSRKTKAPVAEEAAPAASTDSASAPLPALSQSACIPVFSSTPPRSEPGQRFRDTPIQRTGTRHNLMVPVVGSMVKARCSNNEIVDEGVEWHEDALARNASNTSSDAHLDDLLRCIAHTRAQQRFAPRPAAGCCDLETIYRQCAEARLSPALEYAIKPRPKPSSYSRFKNCQPEHAPIQTTQSGRQAGGEEGQEDNGQYRIVCQTPINSSAYDRDWNEIRLVESETDRPFVEAAILLAWSYTRSGRLDFVLTDDQIREVMRRRHGYRWGDKQILRRKQRYVRRIKDGLDYEPAGHVELLQELERGSKRTGKGSRYRKSQLLSGLIGLGIESPLADSVGTSGEAS